MSVLREAFIRDKHLRMSLRAYCYQFGDLAVISTGQEIIVEFYRLNFGLRLEDIPTEFEGNKIKVMMYQG